MHEVIRAAHGLGLKVSEALAEKHISGTRTMGAYKASTLVDFERGRVKPRMIFDMLAGTRLFRSGGNVVSVRAAILNLTGDEFAYNFGNPFSGTHFGPGRTFQIGVQVRLGRAQP